MIVFEFKVKGKRSQYQAIDEAIRTGQFVRNKCLRYWMDSENINRNLLYQYNTQLRKEFSFVKELNSHACQASVERCWSSIARFYNNCKQQISGKKGYPKFKKNSRSVEYKQSGWKLIDPKHIEFIDQKGIGNLKLIGTWDLAGYSENQIKRVRLVRRADGYYCQFCVAIDVEKPLPATHQTIGLDVGLKEFYTDSKGTSKPNPRYYRTSESKLKKNQRQVSRKKQGSSNRQKAINRLGRTHLKISRQRKEFASATRWMVKSRGFHTSFRAIPDENSPWSPSELYLLIGEAHLPSPIVPVCGMTSLPLSKRWLREDKAG